MSERADERTGGSGSRRALMVGVQILGFLGGVGVLVWVVLEAFSEKNRALISRLGDASVGEVALLLGLSVATLALNGSMFWVTLWPERRISHMDVQATNAISTLLSYLPFKVGLICRVAIHNRRDGVPLLTIGAWFVAVGAIVITSLGPVFVASVVRGGVDAWWWAISLGGVTVVTAGLLLVSGFFAHERGMRRIHAMLDPIPIGALRRFMRTESFARLHAGFGMLAHPWATVAATLMRLADIAVQAARFVVAAGVLGVTMGWPDALVFAVTYFIIGMVSPFGMVGTREGGTVGVYAALGISLTVGADAGGADPLKLIVLFVTATESLAFLAGGAFGVAWLRADRLLLRRVGKGESEA
ncbi:MAG: hypothetical protein R3B57_00395 [Phycisphaerales bacterium]